MFFQVIPEACTGCLACVTFCSIRQENQVSPARARVHVFKDYERSLFLPILCVPCREKACMAACPEEGALVLDPATGAVRIVEERCTGCSKCIRACEIGAIRFLRQDGRGKLGKAVAVKCDQCGGDPWCVKVCEQGALQYCAETPDLDGQAVFDALKSALAQIGSREPISNRREK